MGGTEYDWVEYLDVDNLEVLCVVLSDIKKKQPHQVGTF